MHKGTNHLHRFIGAFFMEKNMPEYYVDIYDGAQDNPEVYKTMGPYANERMAEKAEAGIGRNMNHDRYYTVIREDQNK